MTRYRKRPRTEATTRSRPRDTTGMESRRAIRWHAWLVAGLLVALPGSGGAHKTEAHRGDGADPPAQQTATALASIATAYQSQIRPIFKIHCADCHGTATTMPWYYRIPGVRQLMDSDIREAREHLDLRNGFPFGGHSTPAEDLKAIAKSLRDGAMPPLRYRLIHRDAVLTDAERASVLIWVRRSLELLEPLPTRGAKAD